MTVTTAIQNPTARIVLLAEVSVPLHARAWVADATYMTTLKVATQFANRPTSTLPTGKLQKHSISAVTVDNAAVTLRASAAVLDAAADGWYHDGTYLWIKPPAGTTAFGNVWLATCKFYFSNIAKNLNSVFWWPRFKSAPAVSQRIEAVFGEVRQIGGGEFGLINNDGFFDRLTDLIWDEATVSILLGVDVWSATPRDGRMAWADYETMATWRADEWRDNGGEFSLKLLEPKAKVKAKLPLEVFTRDDYPNIDDDNVGKSIPLAYGFNVGVEPVLINPGTKTFKVASHAIRSFDGVRFEKTRAEIVTRATSTNDWLAFSGSTRRYYIADELVKGVEFDVTDLTEENDRDDVVATAGTWGYSENYVYVNPPTGDDWSPAVVTVLSERSSPAFVEANFASVDAANGEFTLGDDWTFGTKVAVDFRGKLDSDGEFMESAVDIIEDLLTIAGETNLDAASFATARARLKLGTDEVGNEVHYLRPALYITEATEILELVGEVCKLARAFVYSDSLGQYSIGVFEPEPSESLPTINDTEILSLEKVFEAQDAITRLITRYQDRPVQNYAQIEVTDSDELEEVHNHPAPVPSEEDLPTHYERDAEYWNQATLILRGRPLVKHQLSVPWKYLQLAPGNQIVIESVSHALSGVFEVLEKRIDLSSKYVTLIVGNLRGFQDEPGFWVDDAATLPSRFSALTGYSAGSLVWNDAWDDQIKSWARRNVGYWTDANGFADATDAESFNTSVWV